MRLEYRQEKLHAFVQAREVHYPQARGHHETEFAIIGDDFFDDGRVIAWRASLIVDGRIVATTDPISGSRRRIRRDASPVDRRSGKDRFASERICAGSAPENWLGGLTVSGEILSLVSRAVLDSSRSQRPRRLGPRGGPGQFPE